MKQYLAPELREKEVLVERVFSLSDDMRYDEDGDAW